MKAIAVYEVKARLSALLAQVESGEAFTVTRRGVPIARIIPEPPTAQPDISAIIAKLKASRADLGALDWRELAAEGRD